MPPFVHDKLNFEYPVFVLHRKLNQGIIVLNSITLIAVITGRWWRIDLCVPDFSTHVTRPC